MEALESVDAKTCSAVFVLSNELPDRQGDIILLDAWNFDNHRRNPVALAFHDKQMPIGTTETLDKVYRVWRDSERILCEVFFDQSDRLSMQCFEMLESGILRGISPGFVPGSDTEKNGRGVTIKSAELLEVSLTTVPVNADALCLMLTKQWDGKLLDERLRNGLLTHLPERATMGLILKKKSMEETKTEETKPEETTPELPPGARALDEIHTALLALIAKLETLKSGQENKSVVDSIDALQLSLDEMSSECASVYEKEYPDAPALKSEPEDELDIPVEEIKHVKRLQREFTALKKSHDIMREKLKSLA